MEKEMEKVNITDDGFQFILTTDELRDKMRWFINDKKTLLGPMMDWVIGVYDKDEGMFLTQIMQTMPGREVFEKLYKYIVFTDDGTSFIVTIKSEIGKEDIYIIPNAYKRFEDKLKEGILLYRSRLQYYFSLEKDITEKFSEIIDKMHNDITNNIL